MRRYGIALGLLSVGGQVLLLRTVIATFNGDELLIGMVLAAWLGAVALGAIWGGWMRARIAMPGAFVIGSVILLPIILLIRISPLMVTEVIGEVIPFLTAAVLSMIAVIIPGVIAGGLFSIVARHGLLPGRSIIDIYLWEGIGAGLGGVALTIFCGWIATSVLAIMLSLCVLIIVLVRRRLVTDAVIITGGTVILILAFMYLPVLDRYLESIKYPGYRIVDSFETHQGHQLLLERHGAVSLITDNAVEAVSDDVQTAENILLPPLAYFPTAKKICFVGRTEFGIAELAGNFPDVHITAIDPRHILSKKLGAVDGKITRIDQDPVAYFAKYSAFTDGQYDIVIINAGEADNYRTSRLITAEFMARIELALQDDGIIYIPTNYDTDRYISPEESVLLGDLYRTLIEVFPHHAVWPGEMTGLLASPKRELAFPVDSLLTNITGLPYEPLYVSEYYLPDRLNDAKIERLTSVLESSHDANSIIQPRLLHAQLKYRAAVNKVNSALLRAVFDLTWWLLFIPLGILLLWWQTLRGQLRFEKYACFLYFVAGCASLVLELISFYVYQSMAGSLYTGMALLIGIFMFGLSLGTWYAGRIEDKPVEYPALILFVFAAMIFLTTWLRVPHSIQLYYHSLFLFVTALATGTLFVGATNRMYIGLSDHNRGLGYAWELAGSALGALLAMTCILPIIGLTALLYCVLGLLALALVGVTLTPAKQTL